MDRVGAALREVFLASGHALSNETEASSVEESRSEEHRSAETDWSGLWCPMLANFQIVKTC